MGGHAALGRGGSSRSGEDPVPANTPPSIFDFFADYEIMANPYPLYRSLQEEPPDVQPGLPIALTRYADVAAALGHPLLTSDDRHDANLRRLVASGELSRAQVATTDRRSFLHRDADDHARPRGITARALEAYGVARLAADIQRRTDQAIDSSAAGGAMELIADLAYPLPLEIICRLLGIPPEDHLQAIWWRSQMCADFEGPIVAGGECAEFICSSQNEMIARFDAIIAAKHSRRDDDVASALIDAEERGEISAAEVNDTARLLLVAAHETATSLIANGTLALLRHPVQIRLLREDPASAAAAVEEVLRYDAPIQFTRRIALDDTEVNGTPIAAGQMVMLWLAAANRDPARFADPDSFDITRPDNCHLAFGAGPHCCLGAGLSRLLGRIVLATLSRRLVDPRLEVSQPRYMPRAIHAIEELPISFRGVRPAGGT